MLTKRITFIGFVTLLTASLATGQQSFKGKKLEGQGFQKQNFQKGTDFSEAVLTNCNFSEAKLVEANFRKATITSGHFLWADLSKADFRGAKFAKDVSFGGAVLDGVNFEGVDLLDCAFNANKFRGANLQNCRGIKTASRCDFSD